LAAARRAAQEDEPTPRIVEGLHHIERAGAKEPDELVIAGGALRSSDSERISQGYWSFLWRLTRGNRPSTF
ncbi:hypothetical protein ABTN31_19420, partial [Acinetobacter baumannii]